MIAGAAGDFVIAVSHNDAAEGRQVDAGTHWTKDDVGEGDTRVEIREHSYRRARARERHPFDVGPRVDDLEDIIGRDGNHHFLRVVWVADESHRPHLSGNLSFAYHSVNSLSIFLTISSIGELDRGGKTCQIVVLTYDVVGVLHGVPGMLGG